MPPQISSRLRLRPADAVDTSRACRLIRPLPMSLARGSARQGQLGGVDGRRHRRSRGRLRKRAGLSLSNAAEWRSTCDLQDAARERISALTDRRHSGLPRLTGARWFELRAEMFSTETVPTEQTTAYPQDGETEGHDGRRCPPSSLSDLAGLGRIFALIRPFFLAGWHAFEQFPHD